MVDIEILVADPGDPIHSNAIVRLLDSYASDPMGGGEGLSEFAKVNLTNELTKRSTAHVILALVGGEPAGLIIAFEGFSTFQCKPILNIHDVVVGLDHRGKGLSKRLMEKTEEVAREMGCCKLTLEVLEGNTVAQNAYRACGYQGYELDPMLGRAMFWEKKLC